MKYNIVSDDGDKSSITVFVGGDQLVATRDHPRFAQIVTVCENWASGPLTDTKLRELFDIQVALSNKFTHLSERVMINNGQIFFDGVKQDNSLVKAIVAFHNQGHEDFERLVLFMEKVETNPNEHSRTQLFGWLDKHHFAIAPDGDFVAYKKVAVRTGRDPEDFESVTSGEAFVNGELIKGRIPNRPGTVVEMARDKVNHDPRQGCSTGLHVANWNYAQSFSGSVLLYVKVNPRDVVSVPTEAMERKMRVCRYKVLSVVTQEDTSMLFPSDGLATLARQAPAVTTTKVVKKSAAKRVVKKSAAKKVTASKTTAKKTATTKTTAKKAAVNVVKAPSKPTVKLPKYYEEFKAEHFAMVPVTTLRWLAGDWGSTKSDISKATKPELVAALTKQAAFRLKKMRGTGANKPKYTKPR